MSGRILIVDDEPGMRTLLGIILKRSGFTVIEAKDAQAALAILEETTPDLLILDVMLPGMDGVELCRQVRNRPQTARAPILILSALAGAKDVAAGLQAGADDYLSKPVLPSDLLSRVRQVLERVQAG